MSFFNGLKKAFGFGEDDLDEEVEGIDARVTPYRRRDEAERSQEDAVGASADASVSLSDAARDAAQPHAAEPSALEAPAAVSPDVIFEAVVKIFNEALPQFLGESVDEKRQREYLYRALDGSMKSYLEQVAADARRHCGEQFEGERRSLHQEIESLREKARQEENGLEELKKQQLSAERQKRALSEKVHELEKLTATLQAENEQYMLENKSLLNKIRLTSVTASVAEGANDETEALAAKIEELNALVASQKAQNEALQAELEAQKAAAEVRDAELEAQKAAAEAATSEAVKAETDALKEAAEKADREAKENMMALDSNRRKLTAVTEQLQTATAEVEHLREQLEEANENLRIVEDLNEKMKKLEETHLRYEAEKRTLRDQLLAQKEELAKRDEEKRTYDEVIAMKDNRIRTLEDQAGSLRKTIENNLYEHARTEGVLREEIERLNNRRYQLKEEKQEASAAEPSPADTPAPADAPVAAPAEDAAKEAKPKSRRGRKPKMKISAIDESITDTDWLVASPPAKKKGEAEDAPEFGYHEPEHRLTPEHPAQMSLWDWKMNEERD